MQISQIQAGSVVAEECMVMDNLTKNHLYVPRQKGRLERFPLPLGSLMCRLLCVAD